MTWKFSQLEQEKHTDCSSFSSRPTHFLPKVRSHRPKMEKKEECLEIFPGRSPSRGRSTQTGRWFGLVQRDKRCKKSGLLFDPKCGIVALLVYEFLAFLSEQRSIDFSYSRQGQGAQGEGEGMEGRGGKALFWIFPIYMIELLLSLSLFICFNSGYFF